MERRRPTLVDVANAAGVSRSTVSRVINGQPRVTSEVRRQVLRSVAQLGYRPDHAARALASGRTDVVEVVVVESDPRAIGRNPFYGRVLAAVLEALAATDVHMRVHVVRTSEAGRVIDEIARSACIGSLLVNTPASLAAQLHERSPRVVSLGRSAASVPFTTADNIGGARLAVLHLLGAGRRRIAAIDGRATNPCAVERHAGYEAAVREAGLRPTSANGDFRRQGGFDATWRLLAEHPDIDAIFTACDLSATGALQALAESGRRVPDDVAVVGFDGSVLASCSSPPLTSVCQPVEEMTAHATRQLLNGEVDEHWHRMFPVTLSVRKSSAA
jgi:DNA-binding LacI/PurR family transcriptional regulator